jgi:uncharacterized protein YlxP (DUF503 family)
MIIGILKLVLFIEGSNSLKAKRMVLHSLKSRLRNSFNVACAQIGDEDKWQKASLVVVGVERDGKITNSTLSRVVNFVENFSGINLIDYTIELI